MARESNAMNQRPLIGAALCLMMAGAAPAAKPDSPVVYIGSYDQKIVAAHFDPAKGALDKIGPVAENQRPTWLLAVPALHALYANEQSGPTTDAPGGVQAFRVDGKSGALTRMSDVRAGGAGTTFLAYDAPSHTLLAANYAGGSLATIPIHPDGSLGEVSSLARFAGSGPNKRQASSHAHGVSIDPSGHWALVTDLGADRIWVLPFDRRSGKVGAFDPASPHHYVAPAGVGPRHMVWHPARPVLYVVDELNAHVDTFGWDASQGRLTLRQSLSTDAPGFAGDPSASEIAISRDGRFVYVGNRGDNTIVVHRVDPRDGSLRAIQRVPSGGKQPWHFSLDASGRWMFVANRGSDAISILSRNPATGLLLDSGNRMASPAPSAVVQAGG
jgi:6-phosphogluconolactonase